MKLQKHEERNHKLTMNEHEWDKLLQIKTSGRDDTNADTYRYPYEPTPYEVLERLASTGLLTKKTTLLDYGCGKGRVDFFLSYQTRCKTIGVEYDERIFEAAKMNQQTAASSGRTSFVKANAETYEIPIEVDGFYFFNPFSVELLEKVLARIKESYYENPREMRLFFYYPSEEYIARLMTEDFLMFEDEIDCQDLFEKADQRERILIFAVDAC